MAQISTTVGLNSGIDIASLVDKLIEISSARRDKITERTEVLETEQAALTELTTSLYAAQNLAVDLGESRLFAEYEVSSSNSSALTATAGTGASAGTHQFTVLQTAACEQHVSGGYSSTTSKVGAGSFSFRFGDNVQRAARLDDLNGGQGISRGSIRITDRSGASALIDLSGAQDIDDVLETINSNTSINVTAEADGDHITLVDNTGQTVSNLKVQEVGTGTTAASLGLAGINVAADTADGQDIVSISADTELSFLNDGNGVHVSTVLSDISYELRDGTSGTIDFSKLVGTADYQQDEVTLGDMLDVINAANPTKLKAEIHGDGTRLVITDLTEEGGGAFSLSAVGDSPALADLGLTGTAVDGVITGDRIIGGLKTVLLSSLNGGNGLGALGSLTLTDHSGASDTVDLSTAETLDDVVAILNTASVGITARVNDAKTGVVLEDTTGLSTGQLTIADADATSTVYHLGFTDDSETTSVATDESSLDTGDLHLQVINTDTKLSALNGNSGVAGGSFTIYDSDGNATKVTVNSSITTIGDLVRVINQGLADVSAEINETGDGISLTDLAGGSGTLRVVEGVSTTAADLHLLGGATTKMVQGEEVQVIDGSTTMTVTLDADDTLTDLVSKVNALDAGVTAGYYSDGSAKPYRLLLTSNATGAAARMVLDTSGVDFALQRTSAAEDAVLSLGSSSGLFVASSTNKFDSVVTGVTLTAVEASSTPVTITVTKGNSDLSTTLQAFVNAYNEFRDLLAKHTYYDPSGEETGALQGSAVGLRLQTDLAHLLSSSFGTGTVTTLRQLGVGFEDDGTLTYESSTLKSLYAKNPAGVEAFLATAQTGFSAMFDKLSESLAGENTSTIARRISALDEKIADNDEQVAQWNVRLAAEQTRLLKQFYYMDIAIGKMQSQMDILDQIYLITNSKSSGGSSNSSSSSGTPSLGSLAANSSN